MRGENFSRDYVRRDLSASARGHLDKGLPARRSRFRRIARCECDGRSGHFPVRTTTTEHPHGAAQRTAPCKTFTAYQTSATLSQI